MKRNWRGFVGWTLLVLAVFVSIGVRFAHPELTETQLFVDFVLVWLWVIMAVSIAVVLLRKVTK